MSPLPWILLAFIDTFFDDPISSGTFLLKYLSHKYNHAFLCFFLLYFMSDSRTQTTFLSSWAFPICNILSTQSWRLSTASQIPMLIPLETFTPTYPPQRLVEDKGRWVWGSESLLFHAEICGHIFIRYWFNDSLLNEWMNTKLSSSQKNLLMTSLISLTFISAYFFLFVLDFYLYICTFHEFGLIFQDFSFGLSKKLMQMSLVKESNFSSSIWSLVHFFVYNRC